MTLVIVLLSCAVGLLTLLVFGLLRSYAEIIRALDRAGITLDDGVPAHEHPRRSGIEESDGVQRGGRVRDIVGTSPGGGSIKVSVTGASSLTLLAFLSSGCRTCENFWEALAQSGLELPAPGIRLVIVGQDPPNESPEDFADLVPSGVKAVLSGAAWQDYGVPGSPYFALVDGAAGRLVGGGTATRWEQMREILRRALDDYARSADRRRGASSGWDRARRADEALIAAGIGPGHPSLDGDSEGEDPDEVPGPGV